MGCAPSIEYKVSRRLYAVTSVTLAETIEVSEYSYAAHLFKGIETEKIASIMNQLYGLNVCFVFTLAFEITCPKIKAECCWVGSPPQHRESR